MSNTPAAKSVYVGLSGGVDSAVSAALLQRQGYAVTGVFIKIWQPEFLECTWRKDRLDALRVAAALGIPFKEIDLSAEYKAAVVDTMVAEYAQGRTPNPDVLCNGAIKFGTFMQWAFSSGADFVATGHYAQVLLHGQGFVLARGIDTTKDQSYFLWQLRASDLSRILMPVGGLTKKKVRELAAEFDLPNATKKDSQGLCFVGAVDMDVFLRRFIQTTSGRLLDTAGREVGVHNGAALYTPGQRHGFNSSGSHEQYVVSTDVGSNTVVVAPSVAAALRTQVGIRSENWIMPVERKDALTAQTRYRERPVSVSLRDDVVAFAEPHLAVLGQSIVFYDGNVCCGGAIIAEL